MKKRSHRYVDMENVNLDDGIKLETILDGIEEDKYYMFKSGGAHYFSQLSEHMDGGMYEEKTWPWILKRFERRVFNNPNPSIIHYTQKGIIDAKGYPVVRVTKSDQTNSQSSKKEVNSLQFWTPMHRLTALCFVPNDDKINNKVVHHINENKLDYRPENLEWTTQKKNSSRGSKGNKTDIDALFLIMQEKEWFKK